MSECPICAAAGCKTYQCLRYGCTTGNNSEHAELAVWIRQLVQSTGMPDSGPTANVVLKYMDDIPRLERIADLLDAQGEYDQTPELQDTLKRSAESETVVRNRETAEKN